MIKSLYTIFLFLLILSGAYAWPLVVLPRAALVFILLMTLILGYLLPKQKAVKLKPTQIIFLFVFALGDIIMLRKMTVGVFTGSLSMSIIIYQLLFIKREINQSILNTINKIMYYIVLISLIEYALYRNGVQIPLFSFFKYQQYDINIYIFFVDDIKWLHEMRYYGFCLEPGYMGLLMTVLFMINGFRLDKHGIVYLIALFLTFSLGGYIITIVAWYIHFSFTKTKNLRKPLVRSTVVLLFIGGVYYTATTFWNQGNNVLNEKIVSRLQYDKEKGFTGNNRFTSVADASWLVFLSSDDMLLGYGQDKYSKIRDTEFFDDSSFHVFFMKYGFVYAIIFIVALILFILSLNNIGAVFPVLLVYLMDIWQHGVPFSTLFLLLFMYIATCECFSNREKINVREAKL